MKYELEPHHRGVPDDDLLADLRRVADELGKSRVTFRVYNEKGRFSAGTLTERFGSWNGAIDKANLQRTLNRNIPDEDLFANLVEVWTALGQQPRSRDLRPGPSRFSWNSYAFRFGTWRKALEQFVEWANEGQIRTPADANARKADKRTPRNINWRLRALVLLRDGARCRLCGAAPSDGVRLHVDHVKPWSKDGETVLENLQILCHVCNIGKGDVQLETESSPLPDCLDCSGLEAAVAGNERKAEVEGGCGDDAVGHVGNNVAGDMRERVSDARIDRGDE